MLNDSYQAMSTSSCHSKSGQKPSELLARLGVKFTGTPEKSTHWRCIAPMCPYKAVGNMQKNRVLKHSVTCTFLREHDQEAYDLAILSAGSSLTGAQLESSGNNSDLGKSEPETNSSCSRHMIDTPSKPSTSSMFKFCFGNTAAVTKDGKLNLAPLWAAGVQEKKKMVDKLQLEVDHIIMKLICIRGLVPNLLDSPEWKELMHKLNGLYSPTSSDTFGNKIIPQEAVYVRDKQIKLFKKETNLTLTFDGTTNRRKESFYTTHATTPS